MSNEIKFRAINWDDAADHTEVSLSEIEKKPCKEFLVNRTTFGKLIKEDEDAIILLRDIDESGDCEITAIPKAWVKNE